MTPINKACIIIGALIVVSTFFVVRANSDNGTECTQNNSIFVNSAESCQLSKIDQDLKEQNKIIEHQNKILEFQACRPVFNMDDCISELDKK